MEHLNPRMHFKLFKRSLNHPISLSFREVKQKIPILEHLFTLALIQTSFCILFRLPPISKCLRLQPDFKLIIGQLDHFGHFPSLHLYQSDVLSAFRACLIPILPNPIRKVLRSSPHQTPLRFLFIHASLCCHSLLHHSQAKLVKLHIISKVQDHLNHLILWLVPLAFDLDLHLFLDVLVCWALTQQCLKNPQLYQVT